MTQDERDTVKAIMAAMASAVQSAWKRRESDTVGHMHSALALAATIGVTRPA